MVSVHSLHSQREKRIRHQYVHPMERGRYSPSRQSVVHDQSNVLLALTALLRGCTGTASSSKRGERAHGSRGNPAREVTISNPPDFTDPAVRGPGPLSVS